MIVYISIGNSDDKLPQKDWAAFVQDVHDTITDGTLKIHGQWFSAPTSAYQNACWCAEVHDPDAWSLKTGLADLAVAYMQDSIAWAEAPTTEFLGGAA
jgi:hypothetical protein